MKIAAISIGDYIDGTDGLPHDLERLYFRMLLKMYSYDGGIQDDDRDNARILGYRDVRTYRTLKAKLLAWRQELIYIEDGLIKNKRVESELVKVEERREQAAESGRIGGRKSGASRRKAKTSSNDQLEIGLRSPKDRAEIAPRSTPDPRPIHISETNKNNDLAEASPSPSPSPTPKEERKIPPLPPVEPDAPREGEMGIGCGVFVNCETIRHRDFMISLKAIQLQLCGTVPMDTIRSVAEGHALQWATDIGGGKSATRVIPTNTASFIRASIQRQNNDSAVTDVRKAKARGQSKEPELSKLKRMVDKAYDRQRPKQLARIGP